MEIHKNFLINSIDSLYIRDFCKTSLKVTSKISPIIKPIRRNRSPEVKQAPCDHIEVSESLNQAKIIDQESPLAQNLPSNRPNPNDLSLLSTCEEQINEIEENKRLNLRRALSVKSPEQNSNKAKHEKKVVRFADALGLDLVSVKLIHNTDVAPCIPRNVIENLRECSKMSIRHDSEARKQQFSYYQNSFDNDEDFYDADDCTSYSPATKTSNKNNDLFQISNKTFKWQKLFEQPGISPEFYQILNEKKLSLENVYLKSNYLTGIVRVCNISYQKQVTLRYTVDNWATSVDVNTTYIENSSDGHTDRFSFTINLNLDRMSSSNAPTATGVNIDNCAFNKMLTFEFAVFYETMEQNVNYWDNNNGSNYKIDLLCREFSLQSSFCVL